MPATGSPPPSATRRGRPPTPAATRQPARSPRRRRPAPRTPPAVRTRTGPAADLRGAPAARTLSPRPPAAALDAPRDLYRLGAGLSHRRRFADALPYLEKATLVDSRNFAAWFVRGTIHLEVHQNE